MYTPDLIRDIEERLVFLCGLVAVDGASNRLNIHLDLEDFFAQMLNILLGANLRNANYDNFNNAGYDLVDDDGSGLVVQVTADDSRAKIQSTLNSIPVRCAGYDLKFLMLVPKARRHRDKALDNPSKLNFSLRDDIWDVAAVVNKIRALSPDRIGQLHGYVVKELSSCYPTFDSGAFDPGTFDSLLVRIVEVLVESPADSSFLAARVDPFSLDEKIDLNGLKPCYGQIQLVASYAGKLDSVYDTYAQQGKDAVTQVQIDINSAYLRLLQTVDNPVFLYSAIVEDRFNYVLSNGPSPDFTREQLRMGVAAVVADAFMRCSIFEGPDLLKGGS